MGLSSLIFLFLLFRLQKPKWQISGNATKLLVIPCGFLGGTLQGAAGLSAPVSVTFLNLIKLERESFIAIISIYFVSMSVVQIPILYRIKFLDMRVFFYGAVALPIVFVGMAIGGFAAQQLNSKIFEKIIQGILFIMALSLTYRAISGS